MVVFAGVGVAGTIVTVATVSPLIPFLGAAMVVGAPAASIVGAVVEVAAVPAAIGATGFVGTAACLSEGTIGSAILGATKKTEENAQEYSWDCWKPILHNKSKEKSKGRLLKDVLCDKRISSVVSYGLSSGDASDASKCSFIVENIWNETFDIKPVILHNGNVAFHATKK